MAKKVEKPAAASAKAGNLWAVLGGLFGIVGLIIIYLMKKDDKFAMFYAKQSTILNVIQIVVFIVPVLGWIVGALMSLGYLWLAYKAWTGEWYRFPKIADLADQLKI